MSDVSKLILAPHCDDEALGCGGLLAKYPDECAVIVATKPDPIRELEFERAREVLGYSFSRQLGFEDGYLSDDMRALVSALDREIAELRPAELYLPYPSVHQDHVGLYEAGIRAGRLSMSPHHWFVPSIYVYDVAAYDINLYPTNLKWDHFEALTEAQAQQKVAAIKGYSSQAVVGPHPINGILESAQSCGQARHVDYAEPFAVVRQVR